MSEEITDDETCPDCGDFSEGGERCESCYYQREAAIDATEFETGRYYEMQKGV